MRGSGSRDSVSNQGDAVTTPTSSIANVFDAPYCPLLPHPGIERSFRSQTSNGT